MPAIATCCQMPIPTGPAIRTATIDDFAAICRLLHELDNHHVGILPEVFQPFDDAPRQRDRIARFLDEDDADLFVADLHTELIGLVTVRISESPDAPMFQPDRRACIDDLVVRRESRGQGIGRLLLARVTEWTRSRELQCIDINVWNENTVGTSFFKTNGFEPRYQRMELRIDKTT